MLILMEFDEKYASCNGMQCIIILLAKTSIEVQTYSILIQIISIKTSIFYGFCASLIDFINGFLLIIITLHTIAKIYIYL